MDYLPILKKYYEKNKEKLKEGIVDLKMNETLDVLEKKISDFKSHFKKAFYVSDKFKAVLLTLPVEKQTPEKFEACGQRFSLIDTEQKWTRLQRWLSLPQVDGNSALKCRSLWGKFSAYQKN